MKSTQSWTEVPSYQKFWPLCILKFIHQQTLNFLKGEWNTCRRKWWETILLNVPWSSSEYSWVDSYAGLVQSWCSSARGPQFMSLGVYFWPGHLRNFSSSRREFKKNSPRYKASLACSEDWETTFSLFRTGEEDTLLWTTGCWTSCSEPRIVSSCVSAEIDLGVSTGSMSTFC